MQYTLKIRLLTPDTSRPGQFREILRNTVFVDSSVVFEYQKVVDVFCMLYPGKQLVCEFSIFNF